MAAVGDARKRLAATDERHCEWGCHEAIAAAEERAQRAESVTDSVQHIAGCLAEYPLGCRGIECSCPCHVPPCDMCEHAEHHDTDCEGVVGYDHLNGDHECGCPAAQGPVVTASGRAAGELVADVDTLTGFIRNHPALPPRELAEALVAAGFGRIDAARREIAAAERRGAERVVARIERVAQRWERIADNRRRMDQHGAGAWAFSCAASDIRESTS